jgi:hypothetical protein
MTTSFAIPTNHRRPSKSAIDFQLRNRLASRCSVSEQAFDPMKSGSNRRCIRKTSGKLGVDRSTHGGDRAAQDRWHPDCQCSPQETGFLMWKRFACYLSGRHEYGVRCESGMIYLRCPHCGQRSAGWAIPGKQSDLPLAARSSDAMRSHPAPSHVPRIPAQSALR